MNRFTPKCSLHVCYALTHMQIQMMTHCNVTVTVIKMFKKTVL